VVACADGGHEELKTVASDLLHRRLVEWVPALVAAWCEASERGREWLTPILCADPALTLRSRSPKNVRNVPCTESQPPIATWFAPTRIGAIIEVLARQGVTVRVPDRLVGLRQLLAIARPERPSDPGEPAIATAWPRQVTFVPSYRCPRHCSYCFSGELTARWPAPCPLSDLRPALDRLGDSRPIDKVNLFGGEPTEYPEFLELSAEFERRGIAFYFATNGLAADAKWQKVLRSPALEMVTVHVEERNRYTSAQYRRLLANLVELSRAPVQAVVRYNLYGQEQASWESLGPALDAVGQRAYFSFALAFPAPSGSNQHVALTQLDQHKDSCLRLLGWVHQTFPQIARVVFSKPFPLCAFSPDELSRLVSLAEVNNVCELDQRGFTSQLQVNPDLTMTPCMGLVRPEFEAPITGSIEQMGTEYRKRLATLLATPPLPRCGSCHLFTTDRCQAGCYAYAPSCLENDTPSSHRTSLVEIEQPTET
jgi:organic radical activating enzyme